MHKIKNTEMQILRYTNHTFDMLEYTDPQQTSSLSSSLAHLAAATDLFYWRQQLWTQQFRDVTFTFARSIQYFPENPAQTK